MSKTRCIYNGRHWNEQVHKTGWWKNAGASYCERCGKYFMFMYGTSTDVSGFMTLVEDYYELSAEQFQQFSDDAVKVPDLKHGDFIKRKYIAVD